MKPTGKQMRHPAEQPSRCIRAAGTNGRMDAGEWTQPMYMPVFVNNADQEAEYRAKGYRGPDEGAEPMLVFQEFPKMLHHPAYVPEVPQAVDAKMENGRIVTVTTPGRQAINPPVTVATEAEEADWVARGYGAAKPGDPDAFSRAANAPNRPSGYEPQRYPMMVGDRLVRNEAEEAEARGAPITSLHDPLPRSLAEAVAPAPSPDVAALLATVAALQDQVAALTGKKADVKAKRVAGLAKARKAKAEKKETGENASP